ncbi:MAG: glutamate--tRNA ligase [Alphaproteobacteria bacterium]|nr:glutamate--tRNA ligase [Alphaproteobacteria bacterium]
MTVVTRFAPSPTGYLHIGGARTALFNWLYARHCGGTFHLRIEDTDRERSTEEAVAAIYDGLQWLGLDWDGEPIRQFLRAERHAAVARQLLAQGLAYHCFATPAELTDMRERARAEGRSVRYDGRWRDRDPATAPKDVPPVIRFKAPQHGETVVKDVVQGEVRLANAELDDMVLLRADGTPTYMLAVVVDDHDMAITHIVRGQDHFTNTFRQLNLIRALDWRQPVYAHVPLIHGPDGAKLSKRHGALGVDAYREQGYLPEAMRNYLLRLGWSHADDEIISTERAIAWFDMGAIGRSAARFDFVKLANVNGHYIREIADARLADLVIPRIVKRIGRVFEPADRDRLLAAMAELKQRAKTLEELADSAAFYFLSGAPPIDAKAGDVLNAEGRALLAKVAPILGDLQDWDHTSIEAAIRAFAEASGIKLVKVAQPLRVALTGRTVSPGVFDVMRVLGQRETLVRIAIAARASAPAP